MKRHWKLLVCLLMAMLLLTACSGKPDPEEFPDITQNIGIATTPAAPTAPPDPADMSSMEAQWSEGLQQ